MSGLSEELEALRRDPASAEIAARVRKLARELGELKTYAQAFTARGEALAALGQTGLAVDSLIESALVAEEDLEDLEAAAAAYQRVLELENGHKRALFALGLVFHDLQRWQDLMALYRRRLEVSRDDGERTTLHLYISEIVSERLGDEKAGFDEIMKASRLAPRNIRIISRLQQLGERTGQISEVAVVIGDLIMHQEDPRVRAALSLRLAELHLGPLKDDARALAYLRAALADDGGNPEILSEIEDVFRERKRFDELAKVLEESAGDRRVGPHRVRLERELARIHEHELDDLPRALAALTRAVRHSPDDRELLDEVMRLGLMCGDLGSVADTYERVTGETDNTLLKTYMRLKLGHIYANVLAREEDGIRVYWAILDDEPHHKEARRRLKRIHEKRGDHEQRARLLEKDIEELDGSKEAIAPLLELARLRETELGDLALARDAYMKVLAIDPEHDEALERATAPDSPLDLARVGVSAVATDADEVPTEYEGHGFGPESETNWAPPSPEVLADLALGESAVPSRVAPPPPPPPPPADIVIDDPEEDEQPEPSMLPPPSPAPLPLGPRVSDLSLSYPKIVVGLPSATEVSALEAVVPPTGLAGIEHELLEATEKNDRPRMIELLESLVRGELEGGREERAFFSQLKLMDLDPTPDRIEETIRLGRRAQGYPLLIQAVERSLDGLSKELKQRYGLQLADVELEDLKDVPAALARFEVLDRTGGHDDAVLGRWMSVLDDAGKFGEMVRVLAARADRMADPKDAVSYVERAAGVAEVRLADPVQAARILMAYSARVPELDEVRARASELLARTGRWTELVAFLESGMDRLEGVERTALRERIAGVLKDQLADRAGAERMLLAGLEERSRDPGLIEALERIYEEDGRFPQLVDVSLRHVEALKSVRARTALRRKIALIAETRLGNEELALDTLKEALAEDPDDLDVLDDIERLRRQRDDWPGVLDVLEKKSRIEPDAQKRADVFVAIADLRASAGDLSDAARALHDALRSEPDHLGALKALADVESSRGHHRDAIEALRGLARVTSGPDRADALVRIGRAIEGTGGAVEEARREFEAAVAADDQCLEGILALLGIAEREQDFLRAQDLAAHAAALAAEPMEQAELWRRAGNIALDQLGDDRRALEHFERALAADPDDALIAATVGELLLGRQLFAQAHPHLDRAARGTADPARAGELFLAAGRAAEKIGQPAAAVSAYEEALLRHATEMIALDRLGALLVDRFDWERVHQLGANLILHHEGTIAPTERAAVYLRMAKAKYALGDVDAASRLAKKANQLDEGAPETLALLAEVLADAGDVFEAAENLKRLSVRVSDGAKKRDLLFRAGRLLGEEGQDQARACAMLAEAQTYAPADLEVAELLSSYRERIGDPSAAADALVGPGRLREGRERAELLLRASRIIAGAGRERARAKKLLVEALESSPDYADALSDLSVMLEFDGDLAELAHLLEKAAVFLADNPSAAAQGGPEGAKAVAGSLFARALELYRFRLNALERALPVSRRLRELSPGDGIHREEHARLLAQVAEKGTNGAIVTEAVAAWAEIVEREPGYLAGLSTLRNLRARAGEVELARVTGELILALGGTVVALPASNGDGRSQLDTQRIEGLGPMEMPADPSEGTPLAPVFEILGVSLVKVLAESLPEPRPKKRDLVGAAGLGINVSRPLALAARVLGIEAPPVYVRDDAIAAILPTLVDQQPALLVSMVALGRQPPEQLRFLIGRSLALIRPRALALSALPLDVLRDALVGFARLDDAERHFADPKQAKRRGKLLEKAVPPGDKSRLLEVVGKWLDAPLRASLWEERAAVYRTANRAGLIVSGSIGASFAALKELEGQDERAAQLPLLRFAATRQFADMVRRVGAA